MILIASDHAGFNSKQHLKSFLEKKGFEVNDLGTSSADRCDYSDFAGELASKISDGNQEKGILVCGSGMGVSMTANRYLGVRAALCRTAEDAKMSRLHNDSNVLCLGERFNSQSELEEITSSWLETSFEGGRHAERVAKIDKRTVGFFQNKFEKVLSVWVLLFTILGIYLARTNEQYFKFNFTVEDGFLEWSSVVFLITAGVFSFKRGIHALKDGKKLIFFTAVAITFVCFFGSGEEISWGQRLFNIETGDTFKQLNTQGETNLHNLKINGVSINKLFFGKLLTLAILVYLLVFPLLRNKIKLIDQVIKKFGIPIATNFQIIFCFLIFALCELTGSSKKGELFEFGATCIFMLIFLFPRNSEELS
jgi:ribose 5-phosphate isomerase B